MKKTDDIKIGTIVNTKFGNGKIIGFEDYYDAKANIKTTMVKPNHNDFRLIVELDKTPYPFETNILYFFINDGVTL